MLKDIMNSIIENGSYSRIYGDGATDDTPGEQRSKLLDFLVEYLYWDGNRMRGDYDDYGADIEYTIEDQLNIDFEKFNDYVLSLLKYEHETVEKFFLEQE